MSRSATLKLVVVPWLDPLHSVRGALHAAVHTLLFNLSLATHAMAMFTNPGAVPPDAMPPPGNDAEVGGGSGFAPRAWAKAGRWCYKCRSFKPVKASHDSASGRCVVKFDHWYACPLYACHRC